MANNKILMVESVPVTIIKQSDADFISLTDMVRQSETGSAVIDNWLRNKNTLEFLSVWEEIYNPAFNSLEFEGIKKVAGLNRFTMSVKQWITSTHAIVNFAAESHVDRSKKDQPFPVRLSFEFAFLYFGGYH